MLQRGQCPSREPWVPRHLVTLPLSSMWGGSRHQAICTANSTALPPQCSSLYEERYVLPSQTLNSQGSSPPQETHPLLGEWNVSILAPLAPTRSVIRIIR